MYNADEISITMTIKASFHKIDIYILRNNIAANVQEV